MAWRAVRAEVVAAETHTTQRKARYWRETTVGPSPALPAGGQAAASTAVPSTAVAPGGDGVLAVTSLDRLLELEVELEVELVDGYRPAPRSLGVGGWI